MMNKTHQDKLGIVSFYSQDTQYAKYIPLQMYGKIGKIIYIH